MNLRKITPFTKAFPGKPMPSNKLPSYLDILLHYHHIQRPDVDDDATIGELIARIAEIWTSASLPFIQLDSIKARITKYFKVIHSLKKSQQRGKYFDSAVKKHIAEHENKLFDICPCKCKYGTACKCELRKKIPAIEVDFLQDMRTARLKVIDFANTKTSKRSRIYECKPSTSTKKSKNSPPPPPESENEHDLHEDELHEHLNAYFSSSDSESDYEPDAVTLVSQYI